MITATANKIDGRSREARAQRAALPVSRAATSIDSEDEVRSAPSSARAAARLGIRPEQPREAARSPSRAAAQIVGRNGEVLSRKRTGAIDPFDVPADMVPTGWVYQWNPVTVLGSADACMSISNSMYENGWRPVPASRHAGKFVPFGKQGDIVRDGQRLEERPKALSDQARAEDIMVAKQLISDRNESLKLTGAKGNMPAGFEMNRTKYRGTGGEMRMSIDPALDIAPPSHTLAEPGE